MTSSRFYFVLPGRPETPTGGFAYDRHMLSAMRAEGRLASCLVLPGDFPRPCEEACVAAAQVIRALPDDAQLIVDGLAFSPLVDAFATEASRLRIYALVHHPLCDEVGLPANERARRFERERRALGLARGVVVTSRHTAARLGDFGVSAERIRVVRPGVDAIRHRAASPLARTPLLLCVASLTPRKGQDVLMRALARLRRSAWRLLLAGPVRDAAFAGYLRRLTRELRLGSRVSFRGLVGMGELARLYRAADLFILPSHHEGYGIAVAEAASYGLPIIASDVGGVPEAAAGAARHRLVPPGNPTALADALRSFLIGRSRGWGAWRTRVEARPRSWATAGRQFVDAVDEFANS